MGVAELNLFKDSDCLADMCDRQVSVQFFFLQRGSVLGPFLIFLQGLMQRLFLNHSKLNLFLNVNIKCTGFTSDTLSKLVLDLNIAHRQKRAAAAESSSAGKAAAANVTGDEVASHKAASARSTAFNPRFFNNLILVCTHSLLSPHSHVQCLGPLAFSSFRLRPLVIIST